MALIVTYMLTCDSCSKMIETRAQECKADLVIPDRPTVMGMDLCEPCMDKVKYAVNEALGVAQPGAHRVLN